MELQNWSLIPSLPAFDTFLKFDVFLSWHSIRFTSFGFLRTIEWFKIQMLGLDEFRLWYSRSKVFFRGISLSSEILNFGLFKVPYSWVFFIVVRISLDALVGWTPQGWLRILELLFEFRWWVPLWNQLMISRPNQARHKPLVEMCLQFINYNHQHEDNASNEHVLSYDREFHRGLFLFFLWLFN